MRIWKKQGVAQEIFTFQKIALNIRSMDYKQHLQKYKERREKILAFLSTGKTQGQAAIRFGISRQRIQQIAKAMRNGA